MPAKVHLSRTHTAAVARQTKLQLSDGLHSDAAKQAYIWGLRQKRERSSHLCKFARIPALHPSTKESFSAVMHKLLQLQQGSQVNCPALLQLLGHVCWTDICGPQLCLDFLLVAATQQPPCSAIGTLCACLAVFASQVLHWLRRMHGRHRSCIIKECGPSQHLK